MLFEDKTQNNIIIDMKNEVTTDVSTDEGTILDLSLRAAAAEFERAYIQLALIEQNGYANTADREHLILRAKEKGIEPIPASNAVWKAVFNIEIAAGTRFSADEFTYICTGKNESGEYILMCEQAGTAGNVKKGELAPIEYIDGYEEGILTELLDPARDEEETEVFRSRYFAAIRKSHAFGGNRAQYKQILYETGKVGACKIYRAAGKGRRIEIYFLDASYNIPDNTLVSKIQELIDPSGQQGDGMGEAPIYHTVDVYPCEAVSIDIVSDIVLDTDYTWENIAIKIEEELEQYYTGLAKTWENENNVTVRMVKINTVMAGIEGVIDVQGTTINGKQENLLLHKNAIPVRGAICRKGS